MIFKSSSDDEKEDFFDSIPAEEEKKPELKPEDPLYWEQEESRWEHLKPRRRIPVWLWVGCAVVVAGLCVAIYLRFFSPYIDDATQYGYVDHVERRGTIFKTYEGVLIPYKELLDTTRIYQRDFIFSAANAEIGKKLVDFQDSGLPVRVRYKKYYATVPWRGASKIIVIDVDTAAAERILPPEFAPVKR